MNKFLQSRFIKKFLILIVLLASSSQVLAVKLEFDATRSSGVVITNISVDAGGKSDADSWQSNEVFYDHGISTSVSYLGALASGSAFIKNSALSIADFHEEFYDIHDFSYDLNLVSQPSEIYDEQTGEYITVSSEFTNNMSASGTLIWKLLPSTPEELLGIPVFVSFYFPRISAGAISGNTYYKMGVERWEMSIGENILGPYMAINECNPCGPPPPEQWTFPDAHKRHSVLAYLGDEIKISYEIIFNGNTESELVPSSCYDHMEHAIEMVQPLSVDTVNLFSFDKGYLYENNLLQSIQERTISENEVQDAVIDRTCPNTQIIFAIPLENIFNDLPVDSEDPQHVRLTILSPTGIDNGHLIGDGEDYDEDGYDDTPRIKDKVFTQTWISPFDFDNIQGLSDPDYSREFDIQIEMDTDNDGEMDVSFIEHYQVDRCPVILVHGWRGSPETWDILTQKLDAEGIKYLTFDYSPATGDPKASANNLEEWINKFRTDSGYEGKFDMVVHSMGAMVSRWYMEKLGGAQNIRQWMGIAPVNHGAAIADDSWMLWWLNKLFFFYPGYLKGSSPAVQAMKTRSPVLSELNYNEPAFNESKWKSEPEILAHGVTYRNIVGINSLRNRWFSSEKFAFMKGKTKVIKKGHDGNLNPPYWTYQGDGVVPLYLSQLQEVKTDCFPFDVPQTPEEARSFNHTNLTRNDEVINRVIGYLRNSSLKPTDGNCPTTDPEDCTEQCNQSVTGTRDAGTISAGEHSLIEVPVDSNVEKATILTDWVGSELNLTLVSPSGTEMEPTSYPVVDYQKSESNIWYELHSPEPGIWTARIDAIDVPAEGEPYTFMTFYDTSLVLSVSTVEEKFSYSSDESATIMAKLERGGIPVTSASVIAEVKEPDGSDDELFFYDDGTNGDEAANDGIYTGIYNFSISGNYDVNVFAYGTDSEPFERTEFLTLNAYQDLDGDSIPDDQDNCPFVYPDEPPVIDSVDKTCISELGHSDLTANAHDPCGGSLNYTWTPLNDGAIIGSGMTVQFDPPDNGPHSCPYQVELIVTSGLSGLTNTLIVDVYIKTAGDADGNGVVNLMDKLLVREHYGELSDDPNWDTRADVTCDGVVNLMDKLKVRQQYGQTGGCVCQ